MARIPDEIIFAIKNFKESIKNDLSVKKSLYLVHMQKGSLQKTAILMYA